VGTCHADIGLFALLSGRLMTTGMSAALTG
jgi:hypothetical protein